MDIAERKVAEAELAYQAHLLAHVHDGVIATDERLILTAWNHAAEEMYGWRAAEVLGRNVRDVIRSEFTDAQRAEALQTLAESGRYRLEAVQYRRDGRPFFIEGTVIALHGDDGMITGYVAVNRDITQRKQAEAAEREQRAFAEALRDTAAVLNVTLNSDAVLDSILANVGRVVAHDTADIILIESGVGHIVRARGYAELGLNEDAVSPLAFPVNDFASLSQMLETGQPVAIPDTQDFPGWVDVPEYRWLRSYAGAPIRIEGQVIGYLAVGSATPGSYTAIHSERLQAFADQAALAMFNARLYEQVRTGHNRLEALSRRLLDVQEAERRHIARELHDEIGQALTGLTLLLEMTKRLPPEAIRSQVDEAQSLAATLMDRVHDLSLDLRPTMLDDLGLLPALLSHVARYTGQTGIRVIFEHDGLDRRFEAGIETAAYRIVQEALTNVARHAGVAEATVRLWADEHALRLQVEDRGAGFEPEAALAAHTATGLDGMRERAVLLGGQFAVESAPGSGALLTAELPLNTRLERRGMDNRL